MGRAARLSEFDRERRLIALLGSILDAPIAQPKTSTGQLVLRNAKRGEGPAAKDLCPCCDGEKRVRERGFWVDCVRCLDEEGVSLGWIWIDPMIETAWRRPLGSEATGTADHLTLATVVCDGCGGVEHGNGKACHHCGNSGRIELTLSQWRAIRRPIDLEAGPLSAGSPVLACMEQRQQLGSYDELGLALAVLHSDLNEAYRAVVRVDVLRSRARSARQELALKVGRGRLLRLMPDEIRAPARALRSVRELAA